MKQITVNLDLSPRQKQAWTILSKEDKIHTEIFYGGGAGGGKSSTSPKY